MLILILAIVIAVEIPVVIYRPTFEDVVILVGTIAFLAAVIAAKTIV